MPLAVLPGSRVSEVNELVPVFGQVLRHLDGRIDNLRPIIPLVPHMADMVREMTAHWPNKPIYIENEADKFAAFRGLARGAWPRRARRQWNWRLRPADSGRL